MAARAVVHSIYCQQGSIIVLEQERLDVEQKVFVCVSRLLCWAVPTTEPSWELWLCKGTTSLKINRDLGCIQHQCWRNLPGNWFMLQWCVHFLKLKDLGLGSEDNPTNFNLVGWLQTRTLPSSSPWHYPVSPSFLLPNIITTEMLPEYLCPRGQGTDFGGCRTCK